MKLKKIYISSFGNLKDFTFDFNKNLNTIKEDNGFGKSTIASFIKCMFYGIDGKVNQDVNKSERQKFKPWNSTEKFGGYVEFSWGNNNFKIERYFGNKESEDTLCLTDLKTGKSDFKDSELLDLGKRIFEIDENGFFSTTFLSQKDFEIKSNTSLTEKFNQLNGQNSESSFDDALKVIVSKRKSYQKDKGDTGLIDEVKRKISEIDEKIALSKESGDAVFNLKKLKREKEDEKALLEVKQKEYIEKNEIVIKIEANKVKKEAYNKELLTQKELIDKKTSIEKSLNGVIPSDDDESLAIKTIEALHKCEIECNTATSNLEMLNKFSSNKKGGFNPLLFIFSSGLFVLFAVLFIILKGAMLYPLIGFGILEIVFAVLFISDKIKGNGKVTDDLEIKKTETEKLLQLKENLQNTLDEFFLKFNISGGSYNDLLTKLISIKKEYDFLCASLDTVNKNIETFKLDKDLNVDYSALDLDADKLNNLIKTNGDNISKLSAEIADLQSHITYNENSSSELPNLIDERKDLVDTLSFYTKEYETLKLTEEFLLKANENLKIKYRQPLQDSLTKFISYFSNDLKAEIDIDLNIKISKDGSMKEVDYFSEGYKNLINICKRFALTEVLFKKEKPFFILDDPFFNLDENNLKSAVDLIKKLSADYQIIYLICHDSRRVN